MAEKRAIPVGDQQVSALVYRGARPFGTFVFAHGAGAGQRHPFMIGWAEGLAARGLDVVTFDFPYMKAGRGVPDRNDALEHTFCAVVDEVRTRFGISPPLALGGKSMGGRIASQIAPWTDCAALVFLGYPLHPPKQPARLRVAHWPLIRQPALFVQGTRDPFGAPEELRAQLGGLRASVISVEGGDHSLAVPKKLGGADPEKLRDQVAAWLHATLS